MVKLRTRAGVTSPVASPLATKDQIENGDKNPNENDNSHFQSREISIECEICIQENEQDVVIYSKILTRFYNNIG